MLSLRETHVHHLLRTELRPINTNSLITTQPPATTHPPFITAHPQTLRLHIRSFYSRIPIYTEPTMADREQPYDPYIPSGGNAGGASANGGNTRTAALQAVGHLSVHMSICAAAVGGFRP